MRTVMFLTTRYLVGTAIIYGAFFVSAGLADQILVNNPSFESQPVAGQQSCGGVCEYDIGPIPGWNNSGTAGQFEPTPTGTYFNYIPDGQMVAYTNNGTISQTVSATVQAGQTYYSKRVRGESCRLQSLRQLNRFIDQRKYLYRSWRGPDSRQLVGFYGNLRRQTG